MRPARIIAAVAVAAAIAVTGCSAHSTAANPAPAPQAPETTPPPAPTTTPRVTPPSTPIPTGNRPVTGRCATSALAGSVQGTEGAAGTIWFTIRLRNASGRTCTVKGIPAVRLLGADGHPVTAPSAPSGPAGSLVVLRPGQAAVRFTFSEPNACDTAAVGPRLLVTMPQERDSLVVDLGRETRFGTCRSIGVQALRPAAPPATPSFDRISDPQVAADRLVAAWMAGDRAAARKLTSQAVTEQLFGESPPAHRPVAEPCRLADLGLYVCSYPFAEHAALSVFVVGGASAGYGVRGVEFGD
jgi:hypothetical protein